MSVAECSYPPEFASVAAARRFVADTLRSWQVEQAEWAAVQVVSELVTNAVIHARTASTVRVCLEEDHLRLEVRDAVRSAPRQRHYGTDATTGRGIALVATLSTRWGVRKDAGGKAVWCELPLTPEPDEGAEPDLAAFLSAEDLADLDGSAPAPRQCRPSGASALWSAAA